MKRLSEVCKMVGVTRRTLQEYNRIGLLSPTAKTDAGYWMYDDKAIEKLYLIRVFVRLGYTRKDIITIINKSSSVRLMDEYQKAIDKLTEQRKEIDSMIKILKLNMSLMQLPSWAQKPFGEMKIDHWLLKKDFTERWNENIELFKNVDTKEFEEAQKYYAVVIMLFDIGMYKDSDISSNKVQNYIDEYYEYVLRLIAMEESLQGEEFEEIVSNLKDDPKFISGYFKEMINGMDEQDIVEQIEALFGEGATEFIKESIKYYVKQKGGNLDE